MIKGILIAVVCVASGLAVTWPEHALAESVDYCQRPRLQNYERDLKGLPAIPQLPRTGPLPEGPPGVRVSRVVRPPNGQHIVVAGGEFGYFLDFKGPHPEWTVESRLVRVGRSGSSEQLVATKRAIAKEADSSAGAVGVLGIPGKPGPYRYEVSFADQSGTQVGWYGDYIAVVKPKVAVRLGLKSTSYHPGQIVTGRVENRGGEAMFAGERLSVERRVGAHWRPALSPEVGPGFEATEMVGAGSTGPCLRLSLPRKVHPGLYRIAVRMVPARLGTSLGVPGTSRRLAVFRVTVP